MKRTYLILVEADDMQAAHEEICGALEDARDSELIKGYTVLEAHDMEG